MRILKVTQSYYPFLDKGGPPVKVRAIARALAHRGHQVTVLTTDWGLVKSAFRSGSDTRCSWGWRSEQDGVEVIYLPGRSIYRALTLNPRVVAFCRQRLDSYHLVHIYGLYDLLGPAVAFFGHQRDIPYIVEPMGMFRPIASSLWLKQLYHSLLGRPMLRHARRLIATAEQERRELVAGGVPEAKVVVRRNGVELPERVPPAGAFRRQWNIAADAKLILFLGRLVPKKSPELTLEAFARLRADSRRSLNSLLVLAGPEERRGYRRHLEALATRLGLNGAVLFTGPLYDEAKWAAYRDADVFVLPSLNENFGNAAAEAVACGTPVIVSDRCGIAPLVDQQAGLVVSHDRDALHVSLSRLLNDEGLRHGLRAGCAEVARALCWDEPLAALEAIYRELVRED